MGQVLKTRVVVGIDVGRDGWMDGWVAVGLYTVDFIHNRHIPPKIPYTHVAWSLRLKRQPTACSHATSSSPLTSPALRPGIPAIPFPILFALSSSSASSSNLRIRAPIRASTTTSSSHTCSPSPSVRALAALVHEVSSLWRSFCCSHVSLLLLRTVPSSSGVGEGSLGGRSEGSEEERAEVDDR